MNGNSWASNVGARDPQSNHLFIRAYSVLQRKQEKISHTHYSHRAGLKQYKRDNLEATQSLRFYLASESEVSQVFGWVVNHSIFHKLQKRDSATHTVQIHNLHVAAIQMISSICLCLSFLQFLTPPTILILISSTFHTHILASLQWLT